MILFDWKRANTSIFVHKVQHCLLPPQKMRDEVSVESKQASFYVPIPMLRNINDCRIYCTLGVVTPNATRSLPYRPFTSLSPKRVSTFFEQYIVPKLLEITVLLLKQIPEIRQIRHKSTKKGQKCPFSLTNEIHC